MTDILQIDVGTQPNQVPTIGDLGDLAFMDRAALDAKVAGVAQTSQLDTTVGALMQVGAFGLGGAVVSPETDLNKYLTGGIYITPLVLTNLPDGWANTRHTVIVGGASVGSNYATQIIIASATSTSLGGKIAFRWMPGLNDWSPWSELSQTKDLGTAASRNVGGGANELMQVGAFGWGGSAVQISTSNFDANTLTVSGWYTVTGTKVNFPENASQNVLVLGNSMGSGRTVQLCQTVNNGRYWIRCQNEGVWQPWTEIYTSAEADQAWLTPTLTNSWTVTAGYAIQYRKSFGAIEIRGLASNSGSVPISTIFTLPVGYRPVRSYVLPALASLSGGSGMVTVYLRVASDGTVGPFLYPNGATGPVAWVSMDGIRLALN